ncbi:MAG: amidohydrolase family protein [Acidobacteriia bacterium]|nr:amidohydrolase family protein [Terriglobia bacterium]
MKRWIGTVLFLGFITVSSNGQPGETAPEKAVAIRCGHLLDVKSGAMLDHQTVLIEGERIAQVGKTQEIRIPAGVRVIDLGEATLLPGLIDTHVHLFLHPGPQDLQTLRETVAKRTIMAVRNAEADLMAGFTSERDLGTEGAEAADVDLRNAIENGEIPGPRLQVSTQAISVEGGHEDFFGYNPAVNMIPNAMMVEGIEGLKRAIRFQIKEGADFVKIYVTGADQIVSPENYRTVPQFTLEEMQAAVNEAARVGKKVAVHATGGEGARVSAEAGVYSIEHGYYLDDRTLLLMKQKGIYLVPTFTVTEWNVAHATTPAAQARGKILLQLRHKHFESALAAGVNIAMGSDVGPFPHGTQAEEFSWMVKYGMTPLAAIQAGTMNAAGLMGWRDQLGSIEAGRLADLVAVADNPLQNIDTLKRTLFVMKGGAVVKNLIPATKQ